MNDQITVTKDGAYEIKRLEHQEVIPETIVAKGNLSDLKFEMQVLDNDIRDKQARLATVTDRIAQIETELAKVSDSVVPANEGVIP